MLDIRQEIVRALADAVQRGGRSLGSVPGLLRRVIEENMWQQRDIGDREIALNEFREFVALPYPEGLGTTIETLELLCQTEPDIMDFLSEAKRGKPGRPLKADPNREYKVNARGHVVKTETHNNIMGYRQGDSTEYAFNRLRDEGYNADGTVKDARVAKIQKRVVAGEISPNRGMIEAGFKPKKVSINMESANSAARTILKYMEPDEIRQLIDYLSQGLDSQ